MDDANEALLTPVDNPPMAAESAPAAPKKRSVGQLALDQATEDCTAFAMLSERLERVRVAFEGRGSLEAAPARAAKQDAKLTSHLEGLAFIHTCNAEVLRRMELVVGRFEDILDCRST